MENPYEEQQTVLLARIIGNTEKLNEAMLELNRALAVHNGNIEAVEAVWTNYTRNVRYNLESSQSLEDPK